jgi:hypothetical protein
LAVPAEGVRNIGRQKVRCLSGIGLVGISGSSLLMNFPGLVGLLERQHQEKTRQIKAGYKVGLNLAT